MPPETPSYLSPTDPALIMANGLADVGNRLLRERTDLADALRACLADMETSAEFADGTTASMIAAYAALAALDQTGA